MFEYNPHGGVESGSFRQIFGVGRFGLGRCVVSAHFWMSRFGPGSFRPKSIETNMV